MRHLVDRHAPPSLRGWHEIPSMPAAVFVREEECTPGDSACMLTSRTIELHKVRVVCVIGK